MPATTTVASTTVPTANSASSARASSSTVSTRAIFLDRARRFRCRASCTTTNDYAGVFFSNTTDLTRDFALTLGGSLELRAHRSAEREPADRAGRGRQADRHARVLPLQSDGRRHLQAAAGPDTLWWLLGSQSRADSRRARLRRSRRPCLIESFLTADPPLKQVVSHTFELGLRGKLASFGGGPEARVDRRVCSVPKTPTTSSPSTRTVAGPRLLPQRRRYAAAGCRSWASSIRIAGWQAYANYAFIDATFRTPLRSSRRPTTILWRPSTASAAPARRRSGRGDLCPGQPGRPSARHSAASLQGRRSTTG